MVILVDTATLIFRRTANNRYFPSLTDLPILMRYQFANNVSAIDLESEMPGHVDIPRLRKGKVGGFFWWVVKTYDSYYYEHLYLTNPSSGQRTFLVRTLRRQDVTSLVRHGAFGMLCFATCPSPKHCP